MIVLVCFNVQVSPKQPPNQPLNTEDTAQVKTHKITPSELAQLKISIGTYEPGKNYSQIISGYGTGLSPPTEQQWSDIAQNAYIVDKTAGASPASVDWSTSPYFPPIGNQGQQASCVGWATGYYVKTFQEAKEHGWAVSSAKMEGGIPGYPTPEYQDKIMSPAFIYNLVNNGVDGGSNFQTAIQLVCSIGECSWASMPYNQEDFLTWPSEAAWAEAPLNRGSGGYQYINLNTDAGLGNVKDLLASGNLAIIAMDAYKLRNSTASLLTSNDVLTLDNYVNPVVNHAATIVGYDDGVAYLEGGVTHYGAFKIANTWGIGVWEKVPDGCYWISYEAMKQRVSLGSACMFYCDNVNYQPSLLAKFQINHARSACAISVGLGNPSAPIALKSFNEFIMGGSLPIGDNNVVLDISEFKSYMPNFYNQQFFLDIYESGTAGSVSFFSVANTVSAAVPMQTVLGKHIYLSTYYSTAMPTLTVSPTYGAASCPVTLFGVNFASNAQLMLSYLNPLTDVWEPIGTITTLTNDFTYPLNVADLLQVNPAGDNPEFSVNIAFRVQYVSNGLTCITTTPFSQMHRGLTCVSNYTASGLIGGNTVFVSNVTAQAGQSISVSGKWFHPGPVSFFWDNAASIGTAVADSSGSFVGTALIPSAPTGVTHNITVADSNARLTFTITLTPTPQPTETKQNENSNSGGGGGGGGKAKTTSTPTPTSTSTPTQTPTIIEDDPMGSPESVPKFPEHSLLPIIVFLFAMAVTVFLGVKISRRHSSLF
ncbi:MAG: C1 family peptidase [Candidatus Bathyarchaeota archaeon]|nr:C1 family peptidase [Candidatus Bathyarchaeota archaeon]